MLIWHHRVSFHTSGKKKDNLLELVYSDVCGPVEGGSLGENKYFLTFIDDTSHKVWVYFLKTKDKVFQYFQRFYATVERETGKPLKYFCTNNGGEYTSKEFEAYYAGHGLWHERTVPRTL